MAPMRQVSAGYPTPRSQLETALSVTFIIADNRCCVHLLNFPDMNLFWQIVLSYKIHIVAINRDSERIIIDCAILCFQLKCYRTISEICKIRFSGHFSICATLLIVSICIKKSNIACFIHIIPKKYCTNAITGMIRNQNTVYVFPICFLCTRKHRSNILFRPIFILVRITDRI